jgi:hypothetical protein
MSTDDGRNPFGACKWGHQVFLGGCPYCAADMVSEAALIADETPPTEENTP